MKGCQSLMSELALTKHSGLNLTKGLKVSRDVSAGAGGVWETKQLQHEFE